jgi:hypothetical protein
VSSTSPLFKELLLVSGQAQIVDITGMVSITEDPDLMPTALDMHVSGITTKALIEGRDVRMTYTKASAWAVSRNSVDTGGLSQGGHLKPSMTEALRSTISSFLVRLRVETGSGSLRM